MTLEMHYMQLPVGRLFIMQVVCTGHNTPCCTVVFFIYALSLQKVGFLLVAVRMVTNWSNDMKSISQALNSVAWE